MVLHRHLLKLHRRRPIPAGDAPALRPISSSSVHAGRSKISDLRRSTATQQPPSRRPAPSLPHPSTPLPSCPARSDGEQPKPRLQQITQPSHLLHPRLHPSSSPSRQPASSVPTPMRSGLPATVASSRTGELLHPASRSGLHDAPHSSQRPPDLAQRRLVFSDHPFDPTPLPCYPDDPSLQLRPHP